MDRATKPGLNRTGIATSPLQAARAMEVTELSRPSSEGDASLLAKARVEMAAEWGPMGTMPPPASLKELLTDAGKMLTGKVASVFVDKLGERLAFERSGVRLYEATLSKFDAYGTWKGGPSRRDLEHIRDEELKHFTMLAECVASLGSDPTAVTPSANIAATASLGVYQVCTDPRATLKQTLEAILIAELIDNDCWENLVDLALSFGREDLAMLFGEAISNEQQHLANVRTWLSEALSRDALGELSPAFLERMRAREVAQEARLDIRVEPMPVMAEVGRLSRRTTAAAKTVRRKGPARKSR